MQTPIIPPAQSIFVMTVVLLVVAAFVCMLILKIAIYLAEKRAGVEYRWDAPAEQPAHGPFRRWMDAHAARVEAQYTPRRYVVMSWPEDEEKESVSDPVCIPVSHTSIKKTDIPDIDAEKHEMPRLSRDITEDAELVFLCVVRNKDGKYRHSANKIYELIGGDRNTVLAKIKEIRAVPPPAEYRQSDGSTAPATRPITKQAPTT